MTNQKIKELSTEELIFTLTNLSVDGSKKAKNTEDKIFMELENRKIISYQKMIDVYQKHHML